MKYLILLILISCFSCTIKSNLYIVNSKTDLLNDSSEYIVTGSTFSMFTWNQPKKYSFVDETLKYNLNTSIPCEELNLNYGFNSCKK